MGVKDAVDLTGRIADLLKKGATLEAQERITELRAAILDLSEENLRLRQELLQLREEQNTRESRRYDEEQEVYYLDGAKDPGPYCQHCWDKDGRMMRLARGTRYGAAWRCQVCSKVFGPRTPRKPPDFSGLA